jgi:hypothetical protein
MGLVWISVLTLQCFQLDPKYTISVGTAAGNGSITVNMQPVASWHYRNAQPLKCFCKPA